MPYFSQPVEDLCPFNEVVSIATTSCTTVLLPDYFSEVNGLSLSKTCVLNDCQISRLNLLICQSQLNKT